ncbi:glycine cleavage system protein R [Humibacter ginsenosidimutans]|uniref:Amino acid-binding ACT protein n=1 Tax=Humibacter ginsenosidimutans TaxID=2599293 RepID=A0A5B8M443_9MICO|nr:ACT domain-containing protein [Humibacter ginsenosidimutans]QDZ15337.1 amino acid-binding ACT protein [Humibacter ginsenosidimutans]
MAKLVLTVVGDDRAGLVQSLADAVSTHGGNWETSELAELAGAFAGIVLVSVPDAQLDELRTALESLDGLLRVTVHGSGDQTDVRLGRRITFSVLGDDRPGIVRDITGILSGHSLTIDVFSSQTREAPMAGGMLFEASITARAPEGADLGAAIADLERLASEIQVDLTLE